MKTHEFTNRLNSLLTELAELGVEIQQRAGTMPLKDEVEIGQALWKLSNAARAALGPIKESLRGEAEQRSNGVGTQFLHGRTVGSRCTVNTPLPQVVLREGVTWDDIRDDLGAEAHTFFTVSVHPDFHARAERAAPETLGKLVRLTNTRTVIPRVTFND